MVGDNLGEFVLDKVGIGRLTSDDTEGSCGGIDSASFDVPTGRLGEEEQTRCEDQCPEELDTDRDSVRSSIESVLAGVDDTVGKQNTNSDAELVARDDRTSDLSGSNLTEVEDLRSVLARSNRI